MKLFDIFFTVIYNWRSKTLDRCKDHAKSTALAFLVMWMTFLFGTINVIIGLLIDNEYSHFIDSNFVVFYILVGIFLFIVFGIRYYKIYNVEFFQEKFHKKSKHQQKLLNYLVPLIMILTLVLFLFIPPLRN